MIMAGGVLGFIAGLMQMWGNEYIDKRIAAKQQLTADISTITELGSTTETD